MIESKDIDAIMGADVVDSDDDRIGKVSQVYVDSHDQHPSWIAVKTGFFGSAETLVPIEDASWDSSKVRVGVSKATVRDAPHVDPDREITVDEQNRLYQHYGIGAEIQPGTTEASNAASTGVAADDAGSTEPVRPVDTDAADEPTPAEPTSETDRSSASAQAPAAEEAPATDVAPAEPASQIEPDAATKRSPEPARDARHLRPADSAAPAPAEYTPVLTGSVPVQTPGYRLRLRKVTVTEQRTVTVTIPVSHEEVRLERVPDDEPDGPDVIRGETDIVLMAERPVVSTEQIAVEHVHVAVDALQIPDASER